MNNLSCMLFLAKKLLTGLLKEFNKYDLLAVDYIKLT